MKNEKLLSDLQQSLKDETIAKQVTKDFVTTFKRLKVEKAEQLTSHLLTWILLSKTIESAERIINKMFNEPDYSFNGKTVFELISDGLQERFNIIFNQLKPHLNGFKTAIDYGCGAGVLTQMISDQCGILIEGVDVRDFHSENVTVPIQIFDGYKVPVKDFNYQGAILTNVIHHEQDNEKILQELNRIVSQKLVIIETVPEADNEEDAKKDWGRMLLNDALWNRFFNYADIPVPGTYETPGNWIKRFEKYGWKCTYSEDLGFDQPTIQDRHHLFVFER